MDQFQLISDYRPTGDQPEAIQKLSEGLAAGLTEQVLQGVTGSGKTFTMANIIANANRPTLVLAHNKTLAAQLCSEFREFSPIMLWSILFPTMITISRKHILPIRIPILRRILRSMRKSTDCAIVQPLRYLNGGM